ncbi:hypothetical protein [Calothrix sp. UHCC 0171]|uniref:hypothetical protein n=1 Tax=Calothrix sp. UHCC 0171 TaxID=3110245 RepID=UPI002B1F3E87|nr:hypothetical protein [Calothrix sp. UHCC 0171]MEA5574777.1 hypothetical protein [Calothrix sp. UHCC 0171]
MENLHESYTNESNDEELTPEEELELSGYQPEKIALIDREYLIQRDSEQAEPIDDSENPLIRFAIASLLVGGVMSFGWMVWSIFLAPKPIVKAPIPKPTVINTASPESDEAARLKAELALRNQESRNLEQTQTQVTTSPQPSTTEKTQRTRPVPTPRPRIIRERVLVPSPPRIVRETVPVQSQSKPVALTKVTPSVEKIDPFERWNQLATLGQQSIKGDAVTEVAKNSNSEEVTQEINANSISQDRDEQNLSENTNIIPAVAIDNNQSNFPSVLRNSTQTQTPGEWGILNRTNPNRDRNNSTVLFPQHNDPTQIQIGTTAKGEVLVPMIWTQSGKNGVRFAVRSQQEVISTNNRIIFPKGTIFIVDVDAVSEENKLVQNNVIASIFTDKFGRIQQQQIPQGVISIQAENQKPLIAKSMTDKGQAIAQQDILIGLLGAAGRAGEVFNQNQNQSSITTSNGDFNSQIITTKANKPNILAAAVEGFFKPMSQRLSQRADKASSEIIKRPDVAILPVNTKVSIFFNNYLEISPYN